MTRITREAPTATAEMVAPLSRLIAAGLVSRGDPVLVEREGDGLVFYRDEVARTAIVA